VEVLETRKLGVVVVFQRCSESPSALVVSSPPQQQQSSLSNTHHFFSRNQALNNKKIINNMPIDYSHIEAKRLVVHTWDKCAHKVVVDSAYMHQATMGSQTSNLNCPECEQLKHGGANVAATR
jgi:hypothetical protein